MDFKYVIGAPTPLLKYRKEMIECEAINVTDQNIFKKKKINK